jgi:Na+-driven multidrug efflux pump
MAIQTKGFSWLSANFALNVVLLVGGLFAISEQQSVAAVAAAATIVAFVGVVREAIKAGPQWRQWLTSSNTWAYIASIVTVFLPTLPVELFEQLGTFIAALLGQNYQGAVLAAFALINLLYRYITAPKPQPK